MLIRLVIHLNTCVHSITAHQIIHLELWICTSSLNGGLNMVVQESENGLDLSDLLGWFTSQNRRGQALICPVSPTLQDRILLRVRIAELPKKLLLNCHTFSPVYLGTWYCFTFIPLGDKLQQFIAPYPTHSGGSNLYKRFITVKTLNLI